MWKKNYYSDLRKRIPDGCRGTTLTELIVTLALAGIFMTAALSALTFGFSAYQRLEIKIRARRLSGILMDRIAEEIESARSPGDAGDTVFELPSGQEAEWIAFRDRDGRSIVIFASESDPGAGIKESSGSGRLLIRYSAEQNGEKYDWYYDREAYMGYTIEKLTFGRDDPEGHPDVIRIGIKLRHENTGITCEAFRYVRPLE